MFLDLDVDALKQVIDLLPLGLRHIAELYAEAIGRAMMDYFAA
jgi:hypothetical protein